MIPPGCFDSAAAWPRFNPLGGFMPQEDVDILRRILGRITKAWASTYLEVGSFTGTTARIAAEAGFGQVFCVDTWAGGEDDSDRINDFYIDSEILIYETFLKNTANQRVLPIRMTSQDAAERFADASLDVVFIDADHRYQSVKNDIQAWLPKVKPFGLICGHDYGIAGFPGVKAAVDELFHPSSVSVEGTIWTHFAI